MNATRKNGRIVPRPFLKWVGGKTQLLSGLVERVVLIESFHRYHEPFVGGGALFFELARTNRLNGVQAWLSDNNAPLIETWLGVKTDVQRLIEALLKHKAHHSEEHFYAVRAKVPKDPIERAARIIYLNKTCYNGLYRENSKGQFNTPFGRYKNPPICDEGNLTEVAKVLRKAKLEARHFSSIVDKTEPGDFVYFDPPYHPVSATASFTAYDRLGFNEDSQRLLAEVCKQLGKKRVRFLLSNSETPLIRGLYADFTIERVNASRNVNSRADRRGKVPELLVRNF